MIITYRLTHLSVPVRKPGHSPQPVAIDEGSGVVDFEPVLVGLAHLGQHIQPTHRHTHTHTHIHTHTHTHIHTHTYTHTHTHTHTCTHTCTYAN